jgi:transcriptional regulator NrdR family protein
MNAVAKQTLRKTGLSCPKCGCRDLRAYYTRAKRDYILRKRICRHCGHEVITRERIGA